MNHRFGIFAVIVLGAALTAGAQTPALEGTYRFVPDGSADVAAAIEKSVAKMSFIKRPIARSRLKKTNAVSQTIAIGLSGDQVLVTFDQAAPVKMALDGTAGQWRREDGEVFTVAAAWGQNSLSQKFTAPDGERLNTFRLSPDGNALSLQVTLTSDQLPAPLTYSLNYRRTQ